MKIGVVSTYLTHTGGVQIFTRDLSRILTDAGHNVDIVGIESLSKLPKKGYEEMEVGEFFNKKNKSTPYDLAICNGEFGRYVDHPKSIIIFHGNYYGYAESVKKLVEPKLTSFRFEKAKLQKEAAEGKYVVTVSNFAVKGLNDSKIDVNKVINLSVNPKLFYPVVHERASEGFLALARGRYYEKGFDILENLAKKGVNLRIFSDRKFDSENINSYGFKENCFLAREFSSSSVFLNPTRFEGGGLTTLESMICGCPVLTTPTGYGYEIKEKIPEFVVSDVDNLDNFIEKLDILTSDRDKYSKLALDYFWEFHNPDKFKREWLSLIDNL